ncbi:Alpha/beta family hydrolase [Lysobacter dokdonensis DS-58]|uniref:Alpha/beta family hydrolase n=1 Tax=Lysobacter dokdonensis DS-58 TaxID=1300345 RepID=A0A0A2WF51_9GAMM|nr:alpha/beta fold hydrolase [Lysobacter dokdonensis]KGQ18383.1 Alpha/beta family hydrolase [Lysobacter dokdonensis DS-58]
MNTTPPPGVAPADHAFTIDGPAGPIEAACDDPEPGVTALPIVAVVCHPLPTEGGTMHNKVVTMTARALRECGATTIRFNFRGTGQSDGTFDEGRGEADDLRTVVAWARAKYPSHTLWLAGFSFGAYVSYKCAHALQPGLLLSIAPPVGRSWDFAQIPHPNCPWIVIQGEDDEIVDAQAVQAWVATLKPAPEFVSMPETSHFFHRKLMDLRGAIKSAVRPWLPDPATG